MWETIGQPKAIASFEHGLIIGNLAHAYLFVGPQHVGKTTLALDLAKAVNCQGNMPPCGACKSCQRIMNSKHSDVITISLKPAKGKDTKPRTEIGIDDVRELQHSASLPPYEGKYKVFIIDGAEYLSSEAANCLLKTLEEPVSSVIICLLAAEELRLLPTVVSRCQRVDLKPVSIDEVERALIELHKLDSNKAKLLARLSQGCIGWAITAIYDDGYLEQRSKSLDNIISLFTGNWSERFAHIAQLRNDRKSAEELINFWLLWWRDVMLTKCSHKQGVTNIDQIATLEKWAQMLSLQEIRRFIASLQESLAHISKNANLRLVFEILMLDMPVKECKAGCQISPAVPAAS
jgi:DNA polymerase-3 subunit delta'